MTLAPWMYHFTRIVLPFAAGMLCAIAPNVAKAQAQDFPNRPIKLLVGFAAGGPTDVIARLIATDATNTLKQQMVVQNLTGASGNLATQAAAKADPDGYTLVVSVLTHNVNPLLMPETSKYDPIGDFAPVCLAVVLPQAVVVAYDSPLKTVADLIAKAKTAPNAVSYGSAGNGGSGHLAGALLASRSGQSMVHVPFRGNAPAMTEVMAGRVDFMFYPMIGIVPMVADKRLRVLAVTTTDRHPDYPGVPTMTEAGFAGFDKYSGPVGFLAPKGTPKAVVDKLNAAIRAAIAKPAIQERLRGLGAVIVSSTPEEYASFLVTDKERWAQLIKSAGIKAE